MFALRRAVTGGARVVARSMQPHGRSVVVGRAFSSSEVKTTSIFQKIKPVVKGTGLLLTGFAYGEYMYSRGAKSEYRNSTNMDDFRDAFKVGKAEAIQSIRQGIVSSMVTAIIGDTYYGEGCDDKNIKVGEKVREKVDHYNRFFPGIEDEIVSKIFDTIDSPYGYCKGTKNGVLVVLKSAGLITLKQYNQRYRK